MTAKNIKDRSRRIALSSSFLIFIGVLPFLLLAAACQSVLERPLPTYVPTVALADPHLPTTTARDTRNPPPATFTPAPILKVNNGWMAANPVQKTQDPLPNPRLQATPLQIAGNYPHPVEVPYLATPPVKSDCQTNGLVFRSQFPSDVAGPWRSYHAYLPPCYGMDRRVYPVLYLIHGSIQDDSHWLELGLAQYLDAGINSGRFPPFIVIMPKSGQLGNYTSGGWKSIEGITTNSLLPYIDANYCTWSSSGGRSIGGISRGGYWALEIAFRNPHLFGAVAGHSSHLRFETDPAKYNPLATYITSDLSRMRIWLDRGEKDFLRVGQNELHDQLVDAGIPHEYWVNPGGHNDSYWAEHLPEYIDWHTVLWPRNRQFYSLCHQ